MEVVTPDGNISTDKSFVLETWKHSFFGWQNPSSSTERQVVRQDAPDRPYINKNDIHLNGNITFDELKSALLRLKDYKAEGLEEIPSEVWKMKTKMLYTLHSLFNHCFHTAKIDTRVMEMWYNFTSCQIFNE